MGGNRLRVTLEQEPDGAGTRIGWPTAASAAGALLAACALVGCGSDEDPARSGPDRPAGAGPERRAAPPRPASAPRSTRAAVDRLTLRQQVGQVIVLAFAGTEPPAYVRRALREGRTAGAILFGQNVQSAGQLRALTAALQQAGGGSALVMTDQEGGPIRIVPFAAPSVGQAAQATPERAAAEARAAARDLRGLGINVTLTPVADVISAPDAALAGRAFSGDAATVARRVRAAVMQYGAGRVGATAKHFPGFGVATANTDDQPVTVGRLGAGDLAPFKSAIAADVPLIMASHALYPALDGERIASQSARILKGLLRARLRFRGVVITDSMEAEAVTDRSSITVAAERALLAGSDLLLFTGDGSFRPVSQHLLALAQKSPRVRARVREAAGRVLALKQRLGLRAPPAAR